MTKITYHYLTKVDSSTNTNKFYMLVRTTNGWLAGWGKRSAGAGGQWQHYTFAKGNEKLAEKLREGYLSATPLSDLSRPALANLQSQWTQCDPGRGPISLDANFDLVIPGTPAQQAPQSTGPSRPRPPARTGDGKRAKEMLKAWF